MMDHVSAQNKKLKIGLTNKWKVKENFIFTKGSLVGNSHRHLMDTTTVSRCGDWLITYEQNDSFSGNNWEV